MSNVVSILESLLLGRQYGSPATLDRFMDDFFTFGLIAWMFWRYARPSFLQVIELFPVLIQLFENHFDFHYSTDSATLWNRGLKSFSCVFPYQILCGTYIQMCRHIHGCWYTRCASSKIMVCFCHYYFFFNYHRRPIITQPPSPSSKKPQVLCWPTNSPN